MALLGSVPLRSGQGLPVDLAVRRQGQRRQRHERGRDHVLRQPLLEGRAQIVRHGVAGHIGDQPPVAGGVLPDDHDRVADSRQRGERRLDLPQLDAEAADLDLMVEAAEELQVAVRPVAGAVARAVEPGAGRGAPRVGDELAGGQLRLPGVAVGQAVAADVEVPRHAGRAGGEPPVEHVVARVVDRPPVRDALPGRVDRADREDVGPDRSLGGAAE